MSKKKVFVIVFLVCFFGLLAYLHFFYIPRNANPKVILGGEEVAVSLAVNETQWEQGLSGTEPLSKNTGMLFIFPHADQYGFWMKDMKYQIDIIWLDEYENVVDVVSYADPKSYPTVFTPAHPARYVLEVPAGFADEHGVRVGNEATLVGI